MEFRKELGQLINKHSRENGSDTPDFILAEYLNDCLDAFDCALQRREKWYDRERKSGADVPDPVGAQVDPGD